MVMPDDSLSSSTVAAAAVVAAMFPFGVVCARAAAPCGLADSASQLLRRPKITRSRFVGELVFVQLTARRIRGLLVGIVHHGKPPLDMDFLKPGEDYFLSPFFCVIYIFTESTRQYGNHTHASPHLKGGTTVRRGGCLSGHPK